MTEVIKHNELCHVSLKLSKKYRRKYQLKAYTLMLKAVIADGDLDKEKEEFILKAKRLFRITTNRHQAEVRSLQL